MTQDAKRTVQELRRRLTVVEEAIANLTARLKVAEAVPVGVPRNGGVAVVGPEFLAPILQRDVSTIKRDATRRPQSLPPRLMIPGSSKLLWVETDIWDWIEACRPKSDKPAPTLADQTVKRKPGRPPKQPLA